MVFLISVWCFLLNLQGPEATTDILRAALWNQRSGTLIIEKKRAVNEETEIEWGRDGHVIR